MTTITDLLDRIERCYDALPRGSHTRVEQVGGFTLFVREGAGWPFYARPTLHATAANLTDVRLVLARQRELAVPQALEWVDEVSPGLRPAAEQAGLSVLLAPLMVLDPALLPDPATLAAGDIELLHPDDPDLPTGYALSRAVANIAFGGSQPDAGPAERDAAVELADDGVLNEVRHGFRVGGKADAVLSTAADGVVARGGYQSALGAAEIVGVATLPAARRRGFGAALSAALARRALDTGNDLVFLSAASETVARVYARIGFRRVATACIAEPQP